jgi:hypothetical protein
MWEQLTPADVARVKRDLSLTRVATLSRHAAELKILDTQQEEIEKFEHLVTAFAEKYLNAGALAFQATGLDQQQSIEVLVIKEQPAPATVTVEEAGELATTEGPQHELSRTIEIIQQVSPNFGIPLRRAVGR